MKELGCEKLWIGGRNRNEIKRDDGVSGKRRIGGMLSNKTKKINQVLV